MVAMHPRANGVYLVQRTDVEVINWMTEPSKQMIGLSKKSVILTVWILWKLHFISGPGAENKEQVFSFDFDEIWTDFRRNGIRWTGQSRFGNGDSRNVTRFMALTAICAIYVSGSRMAHSSKRLRTEICSEPRILGSVRLYRWRMEVF